MSWRGEAAPARIRAGGRAVSSARLCLMVQHRLHGLILALWLPLPFLFLLLPAHHHLSATYLCASFPCRVWAIEGQRPRLVTAAAPGCPNSVGEGAVDPWRSPRYPESTVHIAFRRCHVFTSDLGKSRLSCRLSVLPCKAWRGIVLPLWSLVRAGWGGV